MITRATSSVFLPISGTVHAMAGHVDRCDAHPQVRLSVFRSVSRLG